MILTDIFRRKGLICLLLIFILAVVSCAPKETVLPLRTPARIAVVLGAGASRGFAHIGVLKVLEANKIPVHMIVGTSAGSFVGSLYAHGFNAFQLQKMALSIEKGDIVDLTIPDNGFIKGERLEEYVNSMVKNTLIEKMRIPFYAVATSLPAGQEVIKRSIPLRRLGDPVELGPTIVYLASEASRFMTGSVLVIDGGHLLT